MLALLFACTLFVSASLLFVLQPLVGRMLLPLLGGSPLVWNTCMVFFQATLLLGYLYAHYSVRWFGPQRQRLIHLIVLMLPLLFLPMSVSPDRVPNVESPVMSLLLLLAVQVSVPFFVVSTTAPLLQRWFAMTDHRSADDPYFLYAASNFGSLLALIAYPVWLEPQFSLGQQAESWRIGYFVFAALVAICAMVAKPRRSLSIVTAETATTPSASPWAWVILGMIPSSLLLGVTSYLTTDIAPIPLMWVIPLALYLLTFILAFSGSVRLPMQFLGRALAITLIAQTLALLTHATEPMWVLLPLNLLTFFVGALLCHGWVAQLRPPSTELTRFYLYLSLGGVLGGVFNTLIAPMIFRNLGEIEYPLFLVILALIRPGGSYRWTSIDVVLLIGVVILSVGGMLILHRVSSLQSWLISLSKSTGMQVGQVRSALLFGPPLIVVFCLIDRPIRFAVGLGILFLFGAFSPGPWGETIYLERNSLGVIRVTRDGENKFHRMVHGNTIHGVQRLGSNEPLSFYSRSGPVGKVLSRTAKNWSGGSTFGVVGLGTGSVASYATPEQTWHFFELDPAVDKLARDARYFTFLRDSSAKSWQTHLGDARLRLKGFADHSFDVLMLDAFSSDAIPIHLLTLEALDLYLQKLKPGGLLMFHISNRTLDLGPILERLSREVEPRCYSYVIDDKSLLESDSRSGKSPSVWCVISQDRDLIRKASGYSSFEESPLPSGTPLWRDDRVNLWPAWKRFGDED